MKKNYIFTILLFTISFLAAAQTAPGILWQESLGDVFEDAAYSIKQTSDGGYIVAGFDAGDVGIAEFTYIAKLNSIGIIQWQWSDAAFHTTNHINSIEQTTDGGYIAAGFSQNTSNFDFDYNYFVVKLDGSGNEQWKKTLGGSKDEYAQSIKQTTDGGYIVAGISNSNDGDVSGNHGGGSNDYWIVKLDGSGTIQWQHSLGGSDDDGARSIQQTTDGGYIVAGYSASNDGDVSGNHSGKDYWIVKLDNNGFIQWQKSLGNSVRQRTVDEFATSIEQTPDGGYIVAGSSDFSGPGKFDYWILKLNSSGDIQWQNMFGGSGDDQAQSVRQTTDGGYVVAGYSASNDGDVSGNHGSDDYWIVKLDGSGALQWQKSMGGTGIDVANSIEPTSDNGYIVAGYSNSINGDVGGNHGNIDCWIVKLKPDAILPVTLTDFSGEVNGKQNLLRWTTATELYNTGFEVQRSNDGYIFNKIGFVNTKASNGNTTSQLHYNYSDFSYLQGANYYRLKQIDKDGKFLYSNIVVLRDNAIVDGTIETYPNPAKNILNVKITSANNSSAKLLVTDISGKAILSKSASVSNGETIIQFDISHLAAGTYFLKIAGTDASKNVSRMFIKQ